MKYPDSQVRKANNGYIIQQRNEEYVFDDFIEMMIVLGNQYDEPEVVKNILLQCKQRYEENQNESESKHQT